LPLPRRPALEDVPVEEEALEVESVDVEQGWATAARGRANDGPARARLKCRAVSATRYAHAHKFQPATTNLEEK
jgi:hypothetical protein